MNRTCLSVSSLCVGALVVAACVKGGGSLQGGIEGSGNPVIASNRITTAGAVTSLGSIFVNGVEYDVAGATITIDGASATVADLAPGFVTIVEGDADADGTHGSARRVTVQIAVAGPISAIDVGGGVVTILGQSIEVEQGTIIEGGTAGSPLGGLDVGRDVEVSGFADPSGAVHAQRIAARRAGAPLVVTGYIASLDTSAQVFSVNGQLVSYATASVNGFASGLSEGAPVRVAVKGFDRSTLVADDVSFRDPRLPGMAGDAVELEGLVTRFGSDSDFDVDGHPVATVGASIGATAAARLGEFVKVSGDLIANGVTLATGVTGAHALLDGNVTIDGISYEIKGPVTPEGAFRLNIAADSFGGPETDSGLGQLVGELDAGGNGVHGSGVLIGETCGRSPAGRFCGVPSAVRIDLTETVTPTRGSLSGVIRVTTDAGEEVWPVDAFDHESIAFRGPPFPVSSFEGRYEVHQAEFTGGDDVVMEFDDQGRLSIKSVSTGCTGNGVLVHHPGTDIYDWDLYDVTLTIAQCRAPFAHLNADFEGLSELGSLGAWDYDFATHRMWLSTPKGSASPAAITLWATRIANGGKQQIPKPPGDSAAMSISRPH